MVVRAVGVFMSAFPRGVAFGGAAARAAAERARSFRPFVIWISVSSWRGTGGKAGGRALTEV